MGFENNRLITKVLVLSGLILALGGCASTSQDINSGLWHYNTGLWAQAKPRLLNSVPDLEKENPKDVRVSTGYAALGSMAAADRRNDLAEDFFKRAIASAKLQESEEDRNKLLRNAASQAGIFYLNQKRYGDAAGLLQLAADITGSSKSADRNLHAIDLDNLSLAYSGQAKHAEANRLSEQALKIVEANLQVKGATVTHGVILYNLACSYMDQGKYQNAEPLLKQALSEVSQGGEAWRRNLVVKQYALLLRKLGRSDEAGRLER